MTNTPRATTYEVSVGYSSKEAPTVTSGTSFSGLGLLTDSAKPCHYQSAHLRAELLYSALLVDDDAAHAERLIAQVLQPQSLAVEHVRSLDEAMVRMQRRTDCYELVILNVSANGPAWHRTLRKLQHACQRLNGQAVSLFLCVSQTRKAPDFILRIERLGARYVFER